ncbi:hypothetical protein TNCV_2323891 [Trichonephila clavipes]|nr:hypothetical protein TNCV_2323891 [Trichonephila clavipes]
MGERSAICKCNMREEQIGDLNCGNFVFVHLFCVSCLPMSRERHIASFQQVPEFDRGRIWAYRYCGISFREIGQHVMRICHRWMQKEMTDPRG